MGKLTRDCHKKILRLPSVHYIMQNPVRHGIAAELFDVG
jgi:hypothetical protein